MTNTETVLTYELGGASYEIDHLGICRAEQWGCFAVYCDGQQVAEFTLAESILRPEFQSAQLPISNSELVELAQQAVAAVAS